MGWVRVDVTSNGLTTATTAYSIGDCVDNVHVISGAGAANGGTGMIHSLTFVDDGDVLGTCVVHIYDTTLTVTDNSAFAPSDADADNKVGEIWVPALRDLGSVRDTVVLCQMPFKCAGGDTALYAVLETRTANAVFTANDDVHMRFMIWQDS